MAEREQIRRNAPPRDDGPGVEGGQTHASGKGEELKAELDDLLDEIDEVLETNAEDFVKSYIQKGGQ
jgi:ubiquitin-like protein Pup